jgi:hypothetical protein
VVGERYAVCGAEWRQDVATSSGMVSRWKGVATPCRPVRLSIGLDGVYPAFYAPRPHMKDIGHISHIEALEGRIAPAGVITVTFDNGALVLTSDDGSHELAITALDATTVRLLGTNGTVFSMDGGAETDTLVLTTPIKSLSVELGSGADQMSVSGLSVAGDIGIDLGDGLNALTLDSITTKRGLAITGGDQDDDIEIEGALTAAKKDIVIDLGNGDNGLSLESALLDVGGTLAYTGGNGADNVSVDGSLRTRGSAQFGWGGGDNDFSAQVSLISSLSIGRDLIFDSSASTSALGQVATIALGGIALNVKGTLRVTDGAGSLDFNPSSGPGLIAKIGGANIVTGAGEAKISFTNSAVASKAVVIDASESSTTNPDPNAIASQVTLGGFSGSFSSSLTYIGGAGNDSVTMQLLGAQVKGPSSLKMDLGNGNNTVQAISFAGFFKNVAVTGGTGTDNVTIAALEASLSSIVIDNGDGGASTQIQLAGSKVGQIKVTNGTGAGTGLVGLGFLDSQIGSVSYVSDLSENNVVVGGGGGFFASSNFSVKNFEVTTGGGNDSVGFQTANAKFSGGAKLTLGDGNNQVNGLLANAMFKSLTVTAGDGTDGLQFTGAGNLGAVNASLGAGVNQAAFSGSTTPLAISSLTFVSASAAMETDGLALARVQVTGKLAATFGAGVSTVQVDDGAIGGPFTVDTGDGADAVVIEMGDSNAGTIFAKAVSIILGGGNDALTLGGNNALSSVVNAKSTFKADGGSGMNTLTNSSDNTFAKEPVFENLTEAP